MIRPHSALLLGLAALLPACIIERIDRLLDEKGVTYIPTSETGPADTAGDETIGDTSTSSTTVAASTSTAEGSADGGASTTTALAGTDDSTGAADATSTGAAAVCGDGVVEGDEECDDANRNDADDCLNNCSRRWIVFITSPPEEWGVGGIQGDFNGITGADYQCRHRATKMFLLHGERYKAWISTSTEQPVDRLYHARGPYVLVNGLQVAANWDALVSGELDNPIDVTEQSLTTTSPAWTGTLADGRRAANSTFCDDWTYGDSEQHALVGNPLATDAQWTDGIDQPCGAGLSLYCFEQP